MEKIKIQVSGFLHEWLGDKKELLIRVMPIERDLWYNPERKFERTNYISGFIEDKYSHDNFINYVWYEAHVINNLFN
jgi:hypothetical protein